MCSFAQTNEDFRDGEDGTEDLDVSPREDDSGEADLDGGEDDLSGGEDDLGDAEDDLERGKDREDVRSDFTAFRREHREDIFSGFTSFRHEHRVADADGGSKPPRVKCPECSTTFSTKANMKRHLKVSAFATSPLPLRLRHIRIVSLSVCVWRRTDIRPLP